MQQQRWWAAAFLCTVVSLVGPVWTHGADETWQFSVSGYYSNGKYGTNTPTDVTALMSSLRYMFADGDLTVVVPYLSVTGNCAVTLVSGTPNKTGGTCPTRTVAGPLGTTITRTIDKVTTESGIGDVLLRGRYYLLDEHTFVPTVAVIGQVKVPSADPKRGLGTGKFDERVGGEVSKRLTDKVICFADGGYTVIGKPAGVSLRNQWYYDAGVGYYVTKSLLASVYYEWWRALTAGSQNPQDVLVALDYKVTPTFRVNTSVAIGLSDGAPDAAVTGGVSIRF